VAAASRWSQAKASPLIVVGSGHSDTSQGDRGAADVGDRNSCEVTCSVAQRIVLRDAEKLKLCTRAKLTKKMGNDLARIHQASQLSFAAGIGLSEHHPT